MLPNRTLPGLVGIGSVPKPAHGKIEVTGIHKEGPYYRLDLKLSKARVSITDATTSGSYGALKLFDFEQQAITFLGSRADYTAFASDGTGVPNDTNFVIGLGTVAIQAAADKTLGSTTGVNIGASLELTLSGGTITGSKVTGPLDIGVADGTGTATAVYLNVSGSANTVDDDGWLAVTGTISITFAFLGDD